MTRMLQKKIEQNYDIVNLEAKENAENFKARAAELKYYHSINYHNANIQKSYYTVRL